MTLTRTCMYVQTHTRTHTGPIGKPPPPKLLNARYRTESLSTVDQVKSDAQKDMMRATSEENVSEVASAKVKVQNKGGGFFSRTPKQPPPPKKPARSWLRPKDKGSPPTKRPMSALVVEVCV